MFLIRVIGVASLIGSCNSGISDPIFHSCTSDEECQMRMSRNYPNYAFRCCTTIVCNAKFNYYRVNSGCVHASRAEKDCWTTAKNRNSDRFAARIKIDKWMPMEPSLRSKCAESRSVITNLVDTYLALKRSNGVNRSSNVVPLPTQMRKTEVWPVRRPAAPVRPTKNDRKPADASQFAFTRFPRPGANTFAPFTTKRTRGTRHTTVATTRRPVTSTTTRTAFARPAIAVHDPCGEYRRSGLCQSVGAPQTCCIEITCSYKGVYSLKPKCEPRCLIYKRKLAQGVLRYSFPGADWLKYRVPFMELFGYGEDEGPETSCTLTRYFHTYVRTETMAGS